MQKEKDHLERLPKADRAGVLKFLKDESKKLPIYLVPDPMGNDFIYHFKWVFGSELRKLGSTAIGGKTIYPGQRYKTKLPLETDPFNILVRAWRDGGMDAIVPAVEKYMEKFELSKAIAIKLKIKNEC